MKIIGEFDDEILFESTGRTEYCHRGIIGINPQGTEISYGYDGGYADETWTKEERTELADTMIGLWTRYKENL